MVDRLNIQEFQLPNHPLDWSFPEYLPMDIEAKTGLSLGDLEDMDEYLKGD